MEKYDNHVILQGKIIAKNMNKADSKVASIVLETTRSRDGKHYNRQMVMCFDGMAKRLEDFQVGDFVNVNGALESHKTKIGGKAIIRQRVVAREMDRAKTRVEEAYEIKGSLYGKKNEVRVMGIVTGISEPADGLKSIYLKTVTKGRTSDIMAKAYINQRNKRILDSIRKKDNIVIIGTIQSKQRKAGEKTIYFENLVAMEIGIAQ